MLNLSNVTLIAVSGIKHGETIAAMRKSMALVDFKEAVFITNIDVEYEGIRCVNVGGLKSIEDYSRFIIKELYKHFDTSHCLIVQYDSWIINVDCWTDEFLEYDIIGAPNTYTDGRQCLNGGFSIRSKYFQQSIANEEMIDIFHPCDEVLCRLYRNSLIVNYGFRYAPDELAESFAFELREQYKKSFGFHNFHLQPFRNHIVIKRAGAIGDIIMAELIIEYFAKYNYQVVLDIPLDDMKLFLQYPYYLKHISQMNPKIKPSNVINLDMAYEIKPKQLVLKSYYEMAGIRDGELRNSRLYMHQEPHQKIFQKYILIHNDQTNMPHRNSYGVNWELIVAYFQKLGYLVFQIGNNPIERIAPHFNCATKDLLMYMCKGADLVIALDSGVAQISVALDTPTIIMAGSVDLKLRYSNFEKIGVVQGECGSEENKHCYHSAVSTTGVECIYDKERPPCCSHSEWNIIEQANKLLNK